MPDALAGCTERDPGLEGAVEVRLAALSGEIVTTADDPARPMNDGAVQGRLADAVRTRITVEAPAP